METWKSCAEAAPGASKQSSQRWLRTLCARTNRLSASDAVSPLPRCAFTSLTTARSTERPPSVAVLRFVSVSENPQDEYLAFGIAEALLDALARVTKIRVASRTNAFQFDSRSTTVHDIGEALGVDYLLEDSLQRKQDVLRAVVQLIRVDDGFHLFSIKIDRSVDDIIQVQDQIANEVVKHLKIHIDDAERRRMLDWGTINVDAYLLALEGLYQKDYPSDQWHALELFDRALALDDGLLGAYVGAGRDAPSAYVRSQLRARGAACARRQLSDPCSPTWCER